MPQCRIRRSRSLRAVHDVRSKFEHRLKIGRGVFVTEQDSMAPAYLEDYKLKAAFPSGVIGRVLTEFQTMITLETAVATGLIFTTTGSLRPAAPWMALLLVGISGAWAVVGFVASRRSGDAQAACTAAGKSWAVAAGVVGAEEDYLAAGDNQSRPKSAWLVPAGLCLIWIVVLILFQVDTF